MTMSVYNDAIDEIRAIFDEQIKRGHPVYDEFERANRILEDRVSSTLDKLALTTEQLYEFFMDEYYRGDSENSCFDKAVNLVVDSSVATFLSRNRSLSRELSDRELRDFEDALKEYGDVSQEYRMWNRGGSRYSREDRARDRGRRHDDNRDRGRSSQSRSYFSESGGVSRTRATDARTAARLERMDNERRIEREQRVERETRRSDSAKRNDGRVYLKSLNDIRLHPRRPNNLCPPPYDPSTQRLSIYLDHEGYVEFEVLELKDMDAEAHKRVVMSMYSAHRENEYQSTKDTRVVYRVNGYDIDRRSVENDAMREIIKEMKEMGRVEKNAGFNDLSEELKEEALRKATDKINKMNEVAMIQKRRENIEKGNISEVDAMEIKSLPTDNYKPTSLKDAVNQIIINRGDQLSNDRHRENGYVLTYEELSVLHRDVDKLSRDLVDSLLVGLYKKNSTLEKIYASLRDKKIPLHLYDKFNNLLTKHANLGIAHILDTPALTLDSFVDEFKDFSDWVVNQIESGNLTNEKVNAFNKYLSTMVARIANVSKEEYAIHFGIKDEVFLNMAYDTTIVEVTRGKVIYVPYLSSELGISNNTGDIIKIDRSEYNGSLIDLIQVGKHYSIDDFIVTNDGCCYRIIDNSSQRIVLGCESI